MNKILILGCNSFLGSNFLKNRINHNIFDIYATYNTNNYRLKEKKIKINEEKLFKLNLENNNSDLIDLIRTINPEIIVNFIGNSNLDKTTYNHKIFNIDALKKIFNSIKLSNVRINHFYNIGSCEEYMKSSNLIKESFKLKSNNIYGFSKIESHNFALKYSRDNNINYTNLRTFNVIGKDTYKKNIILQILENNNKKKLILKNPRAIRDFIWIDDYIKSLVNILVHNKKNYQAINIGRGIGTSIKLLIKKISNVNNKKYINLFNQIDKSKDITDKRVANISILKKFINTNEFLDVNEMIKLLI